MRHNTSDQESHFVGFLSYSVAEPLSSSFESFVKKVWLCWNILTMFEISFKLICLLLSFSESEEKYFQQYWKGAKHQNTRRVPEVHGVSPT